MTSYDAATQDAARDADSSLDHAKKAVNSAKEAFESSKRALPEITKEAQRLVGERVTELRGRGKEAASVAGDKLEDARLYATDQIQERPLAATLAALGVGFLLGLLISGRR